MGHKNALHAFPRGKLAPECRSMGHFSPASGDVARGIQASILQAKTCGAVQERGRNAGNKEEIILVLVLPSQALLWIDKRWGSNLYVNWAGQGCAPQKQMSTEMNALMPGLRLKPIEAPVNVAQWASQWVRYARLGRLEPQPSPQAV